MAQTKAAIRAVFAPPQSPRPRGGAKGKAAGEQVREEDQSQPGHDGEGAERELAMPEHRPPGVKQQVVARRVDVTGSALDDQRQRPLGEACRIALVVPQGLGIQAIEAQEGAQKQNR